MFSFDMIDSLRFYEGDTRIRNTESGIITCHNSTDVFWGDKVAYKTLNAILIPGINNERDRIDIERTQLNTSIIDEIESVINIYCDMYEIMLAESRNNKAVVTKRVERYNSFLNLSHGELYGFASTSKKGFDTEFAKKNGIVLLEFNIPSESTYIDMEFILGKEYLFYEEREVLLPPFTQVTISEAPLSKSDMKIKDMFNNIPKGKFIIKIINNNCSPSCSIHDQEALKSIVLNKDNRKNACNCLKAMNKGNWDIDFTSYIDWKKSLQQYIKITFHNMNLKHKIKPSII